MTKSRKILCIVLAALIAAVAITLIVFANSDEYNLRANTKVYPEMYDKEAASTVSCFKLDEAVSEEVYVECPLDTDNDGMRDLVRIRISRPKGSGENGFRVPVILEHSPYNGVDQKDFGELKEFENVYVEQSLVGENGVKDTSGLSYDDIEYTGPTAADWPWGDGAYNKNGVNIPASAGAKPVKAANEAIPVVGQLAGFYEYMFSRGYAVIKSSFIGSYYPMQGDEGNMANEGINNVGSPEETVCGMAVINWLNGKCRAYTDKTRTNEVNATEWCTGKVCMVGTSYVGSIALSVAATGIEGLECIMPVAAIINWYDYYRNNGGVFGGEGNQGEDAVSLTAFCYTRTKAQGYDKETDCQELYAKTIQQIRSDGDRITGDYNTYWDARNSLKTIDKWRAAVMCFQGFNDKNVDAVHFDQLYRVLKNKDKNYPISLILHQQYHVSVFDQADGEILKLCHRWLDHYLYGIDNGVEKDEYEVMSVDSSDGSWKKYKSWPIEGTETKRFYLNNNGLSSTPPEAYTEKPIFDQLKYRTLKDFCADPSDPYYVMGDWNSIGPDGREMLLYDYNNADTIETHDGREVRNENYENYQKLVGEGWEKYMIDADNITSHTDARLAYMSEPFERDMILNGTPKISLMATPDKGKGTLSVAIVELGEKPQRLKDEPATLLPEDEVSGMEAWQLHNYTVDEDIISSYNIIARGSVDIQNPNKTGKTYLEADADTGFMPEFYWQTSDIQPGEMYNYVFTLEPCQHTIKKGTRIAVVVYTTDYFHTIMPEDVTRVELTTGENTFIEMPLK